MPQRIWRRLLVFAVTPRHQRAELSTPTPARALPTNVASASSAPPLHSLAPPEAHAGSSWHIAAADAPVAVAAGHACQGPFAHAVCVADAAYDAPTTYVPSGYTKGHASTADGHRGADDASFTAEHADRATRPLGHTPPGAAHSASHSRGAAAISAAAAVEPAARAQTHAPLSS